MNTNIRLFSLILAYSRLLGRKYLGDPFLTPYKHTVVKTRQKGELN